MAEKGLPAPTPKLKKKFPVTGQITKKGNNLNPKVIVKPIDQNQGQNTLNPPNQLVHLPDQPQDIPNPPPPPPNPPNPPNTPNQPNQPNQPDPMEVPNPQNPPNPPNPQNPPNQPNPIDQPNPPQPQLMNWSYLKPDFSGKAEEDAGHASVENQ